MSEHAVEQIDEKALLSQAESLMSQNRWKDAIALLYPHQKENNLSISAMDKLAYCYSRTKEYRKAIPIYRQLSEMEPDKAMWFYCLAYQYSAIKETQQAIESYEKCLSVYSRWLKVFPVLAKLLMETGAVERASKICQDGIDIYQAMKSDSQSKFSDIYADLCSIKAKLVSGSDHSEAERLLKEAVAHNPQDANEWYGYGNFLLQIGRAEEAIEKYRKAESLEPRKEYIPHKIAQAYLLLGDADQALKTYETIRLEKRVGYILNGIAKCLVRKGDLRGAVLHLYRATKGEPDKWYHYRDLGMVLADLEDRDQSIEFLNRPNDLYRKENGSDFSKILARIEELKALPSGSRVNLKEFDIAVPTISYGTVLQYDSKRGFGFIIDEKDKKKIFFHISKVKNNLPPPVGSRVKFVKEEGEKGPMALKIRPVETR